MARSAGLSDTVAADGVVALVGARTSQLLLKARLADQLSGPLAVLETWTVIERSAVLPKAAESTSSSVDKAGDPPPDGGLTRSPSLQVANRTGRPNKTPVAT